MSASDLVSALNFLIKLGFEIQTRLDSLNQAAEDLQPLDANLKLLLKIFENPVNEHIGYPAKHRTFTFRTQNAPRPGISTLLERQLRLRERRRMAGGLSSGYGLSTGFLTFSLKFSARSHNFSRYLCNAVSTAIVNYLRTQQGRTSGKETAESTSFVKKKRTENHLYTKT